MSLWWPPASMVRRYLKHQGYVARDWQLLDAALARPLTSVAGGEAFGTIWLKAAAVLDSVERYHPLIDGNKRLGLYLLLLVLEGNGYQVDHISDDALYDLIMDTASTHVEISDLATRVQCLVTQN